MKNEVLTIRIRNRILMPLSPIFSGETIGVKLAIDAADADASKHKLVLFADDKTALAESDLFTAEDEEVWAANLNTATNQMSAYFADIEPNASKQVGCMVVNVDTADIIARGNLLVISTPFPNELIPVPQTYHYATSNELEEVSSSLSAQIEEASSSLDEKIAVKSGVVFRTYY
jgi:hypothetical protein